MPFRLLAGSMYLPTLTLRAVLPLPKTSSARPPRGETSLKLTPSVRSKLQRRRQERLAVDERGTDRLRRRVAPRVVESNRALQRHSSVRPLVLRVQRRGSHAVPLREHAKALGQLRGPAAVELIGEVEIVPEVLDVFHEIAALVPELHVVGAGDVRRREAPPVRIVEVLRPVGGTVIEIRDRAVPGRELGHADETARRVARHLEWTPCGDDTIPTPASSNSRFVIGDCHVT